MIEPALLKKLGWSDSLISEVVRTADNLKSSFDKLSQVQPPNSHYKVGTSNYLIFDETEINTCVNLQFSSLKK